MKKLALTLSLIIGLIAVIGILIGRDGVDTDQMGANSFAEVGDVLTGSDALGNDFAAAVRTEAGSRLLNALRKCDLKVTEFLSASRWDPVERDAFLEGTGRAVIVHLRVNSSGEAEHARPYPRGLDAEASACVEAAMGAFTTPLGERPLKTVDFSFRVRFEKLP